MKKIETHMNNEQYTRIRLVCERLGISVYAFLKQATLAYLEAYEELLPVEGQTDSD